MPEIQERPPPMFKTSMAGFLEDDARDPRASTTYIEDIDIGALGSDAGDLGAPTTYVEDVDGGPPGRRCQRSGSAHHLC
jgi:hypothetical protein